MDDKPTRYYYGPHLHAALKCLRAGYRKNAVSWMQRDGERFGPYQPDPDSLEDTRFPDGCNNFECIAWRPLMPQMIGEGI